MGRAGYFPRKHGWVVDNFVRATVCTANGELVECSEDVSPDLFWGIRGGGGHFGIVVSLTMRCHPITNVAVVEHPTFCLSPLSQTKEMLLNFDKWATDAPKDCSAFFILPCLAPST